MTDKTPLYQQIAESVRQEILYQNLEAGDLLPTVRALAVRWQCTPGTVQRAYRELARQGIATSQVGQGTRVAGAPGRQNQEPMRQATLVHSADTFLLQMLTASYTVEQIDAAMRAAMDRYRALIAAPEEASQHTLRFSGSHDPLLSLIASELPKLAPGYSMEIAFTGSLGGLIALARGEADIAGSHLWEAETNTFNIHTIKRLLPGERVALMTLAHRRLGLIVAQDNPYGVADLADLQGLRFINRQPGAGTRVWLEKQLKSSDIDPSSIQGFDQAVTTHAEVARRVASGEVDTGIGIEAAAHSFRLAFIPLTTERYDLVIPHQKWDTTAVAGIRQWLQSESAHLLIAGLGGYDTQQSGQVSWVR